MPVYQVSISYRVPLNEHDTHAHGLTTAEKIISQLAKEFDGVPHVRVSKPTIVRNDA